MGQRRLSGAKVGEGDPHAEQPQPLQLEGGRLDVADHGRLGDFERQPLWGQAALGKRRAHVFDQSRVRKLARREVHPDKEGIAMGVLAVPRRGLHAGLHQDRASEGHDQACLLG
jgi:hypothetical protein